MALSEPNPNPFGVPLHELMLSLAPSGLEVSRDGDTLVAKNQKLTTFVEVRAPEETETADLPIQAVVTIKTPLPEEFDFFKDRPDFHSDCNTMASLGAITLENDHCFVGSRLTIYEGEEEAWNIQSLLILFTIIVGAESIFGSMRRMLTNEPPMATETDWTEADFALVQSHLSEFCLCNAGGLGLTAEFGLKSDAVSAIAGDHETALWQIKGDQPHPELGGGLFCLLQLPYSIDDDDELHRVIASLNAMEMAPSDLPPHFGAWCKSKNGNLIAYVSFLPNALHRVNGIALNMSIWAMHRANWADAMLVVLGAR